MVGSTHRRRGGQSRSADIGRNSHTKLSELDMPAVRSALSQTFKAIEVIVIVDGPDETAVEILGAKKIRD